MLEQYAVVGSILSSLCALVAVALSIRTSIESRMRRKEDKQEHQEEKLGERHNAQHQRIESELCEFKSQVDGNLAELYTGQREIKDNYLDRFAQVHESIHETRLDLTEQIHNLKTETLLGIQRIQEMIIGKL